MAWATVGLPLGVWLTNSISAIEIRYAIELIINMLEMAYGLPYKHDNHTIAVNFIDAQWERITSQSNPGRKSDLR